MPTSEGLELHPFRGVRYAPDRVDLAAVTSPPYDLIAPGDVEVLEGQDAHNVVRLVLADGSGSAVDRYDRAGKLLREWLGNGVLARDTNPALYVHEQRSATHLQRGLLGAVGLRAAEERLILPHEEVHPAPVADRFAQMQATGANLEPIYLLVPGMGGAGDAVTAVADHEDPLIDASTPDGTRHRLWAIVDTAMLQTIASALRPRQALIADGHHRYAAYRMLQDSLHTDGKGAGPWDAGLALFVDSLAYPPQLQAIHRVIEGLRPNTLLTALPSASTVAPVAADPAALLRELASARRPGVASFVVAGDGRYRLVTVPHYAVEGLLPSDRSPSWRGLDVSVLHHGILDGPLRVEEEAVQFTPDPDAAVQMAGTIGGTAVLLNPPTVQEVTAVAAAAERMPRKSTSFGPKPRNGWAFRLLDP